MILSERLEEHQDAVQSTDWKCAQLYRSVMDEHRQVVVRKKGYLYHSTLWAAMTPAGNIYRYLALATERHRNCADIWRQLDELAERHAALLGGEQAPLEARSWKLCRALEQATVHGALDAEKGEEVIGFKPLEEYFSTRVQQLGPLIYPVDGQQFMDWLTHRAIAAMICLIQLTRPNPILTFSTARFTAPLVIFMDEWSRDENKLRDPRKFVSEIRLNEVFCLGTNFRDKLHTIMGGILLQLVILIIHSYVIEQHNSSKKSGTLPKDTYWYVLGNVTNQVCTFMTILTAPILFWNEDSPTSMAMDSLTVLFIFMLDDFAGYACTYMGKTDESYSRSAAWQKGLLTQCPVSLSDLIDPSAANASELWSIRYSADGQLLCAQSEDGCGERVCPRRLERLRPTTSDERTALVQAPDQGEDSTMRLWYRNSPTSGSELPGYGTAVLGGIWTVLSKFSLVVQFMLPLAWMAVNKPCSH